MTEHSKIAIGPCSGGGFCEKTANEVFSPVVPRLDRLKFPSDRLDAICDHLSTLKQATRRGKTRNILNGKEKGP